MRYFISNDSSGHTYLVPFGKEVEWDEWRHLPEDDPTSWEAPDWVWKIEGGTLTFENPEYDGKPISNKK